MAETTGIGWTDHTFNPWWGCTRVSAGCDNCYAEKWNKYAGKGNVWGHGQPRRVFGDKHWADPKKWNAAAQKAGVNARVFSASMADVFDNEAPDGQFDRLLETTYATPNLDWQVLTKRPGRIVSALKAAAVRLGDAGKTDVADWLDAWIDGSPPENVWLGTSIEDDRVLSRVGDLLKAPAKVHFLSIEPLIGPLPNLDLTDIEWVIIGGESQKGCRPMEQEWAEDIIAQCNAAGVPVFFKQAGELLAKQLGCTDKTGHTLGQLPASLQVRQYP